MKAKKIPGEFAETVEDNPLWKAKREKQARSREAVRNGKRTQESMFLIPPEIAKASKVRYK